MNRLSHQLDHTTNLSRELMLMLFVTLITTINIAIPTSANTTTTRNATRDSSNIVSYEPPIPRKLLPSPSSAIQDKANNSSETLSISQKDHQKLSTPTLDRGIEKQLPSSAASFDLVLKDESTQKYKRLREHETDRHSYNSNSSSSSSLSTTTTTTPKPDKDKDINSKPEVDLLKDDDMITSDSRFHSKSVSPRMDEDYDTPMEDDTFGSVDGIYDEASSNLSEQKVVKELTKMISKGMAGATDQMKLDTLENWKRRQKERKVVKDTRAKLFEDLLTAAINSHPEKVKKSKKGETKSGSNNQRSNANQQTSMKAAPLLPEAYNLDPELAGDAETVIKHLQGVANVIESTAPPGYEEGGSSLSDESPAASDDSSSSSEASDSSENTKTTSKNKGNKEDERPIVRQFKKIKNQISQRRKQLDAIKKILNVDLAINPKDGSLVGKSTNNDNSNSNSNNDNDGTTKKKKKKKAAEDSDVGGGGGTAKEWGDFTIIDDSTLPPAKTKKRSGGSGKGAKMNELMHYLRENPEILASVMAELTTDADSRVSSSPSFSSRLTPSSSSASSLADDNVDSSPIYEHPSHHDLIGRKTGSGSPYRYHELERILWDRARKASRHIDHSNMEMADLPAPSVIVPSNMKQSQHDLYRPSSYSHNPLALSVQKSAEARLLESLRDRQLLNLMKLDMVLAERQQQASNRSHTFTIPNAPISSLQPSLSPPIQPTIEPKSYNSNNYQQKNNQSQRAEQLANSQRNSNMLDEEIVHHFMVMNGHISPSTDTSSLSNSNRFTNGRQQPTSWRPPSQQQQHNSPVSHKAQHDSNNYQHQYSNQDQQSTAGSQFIRGLNQQQQQQYAPLNRFKEWRDVGQSEASSSQRNDAINNIQTNVTWVPYDLTTGGSTAEIERHGSSISQQQQYHHQQHQKQLDNPLAKIYSQTSSLNDSYSPATTATATTSTGRGNHQVRDYSDSIVIKPDHYLTSAYHQSADEDSLMNPSSSVFMTRSSIAQKEGSNSNSPVATDIADKADSGDHQPKGRISREDIDDDESDSMELEDSLRGRQRRVAPVNYFSAYKKHNQPSSASGYIDNSAISQATHFKKLSRPQDNSEQSDDGAIWAK